MNEIVDVSKIDAVVIPRDSTPHSATVKVVELMKEVFNGVSPSYILHKEPCDMAIEVNDRYREIFENLKDRYKKKDFVYITEMPFFVIIHRDKADDDLWYNMITSTVTLVESGFFDRKTMEIITVSHSMKSLKERIEERING